MVTLILGCGEMPRRGKLPQLARRSCRTSLEGRSPLRRVVLAQLSVEGLAIESEYAGGLGPVLIGGGEHVLDVAPFDLGDAP